MPKLSGIYKIENLVNGHCYIGQSVDLKHRKCQHFSNLKMNVHVNKHLQSAYNKYGSNNFLFSIILFCEKNELTYYEQSLVDKLSPEYNICKECVSSPVGVPLSDEAKLMLSENRKGEKNPMFGVSLRGESNGMYGKKHSELSRKRMAESRTGERNPNFGKKERPWLKNDKNPFYKDHSGENNPFFGKKHTEESRKKISKSLIGRKSPNEGKHLSEETRRKLSESHKGISHLQTEETREKISNANKGKTLSPETKKKISEKMKEKPPTFLGKHHSEESKKKISESKKGKVSPNKGKNFSEETKAQMSKSKKEMWKSREVKSGYVKKKLASSRFFGVNKTKSNTWEVYITLSDRNQKYIGVFKTEIEAALAFNEYASEYFGWKANLNVITEEEYQKIWEE